MQFPNIPAIEAPNRNDFETEILPDFKPVVMRNLAQSWPAVGHAKNSAETLFSYLSKMDTGRLQRTLVKKTEDSGRFFYSENLRTQNYGYAEQTVSAAIETLLAPPDPRTRYIQSVKLEDHFYGFSKENSLPLIDSDVAGRAWIGGQTTVQTHFDTSENIAVCVLGEREFTLFPPDQLANLYLGPLETAPGGANVSLTNLDNPDFVSHPRFEIALNHAQRATLKPGDGIYIPYGWWHHVRAVAPLNMLVNYWWSPKTSQLSNPLAAMSHAMMVFRDLPEGQRQVWKNMFAQFVFMENGEPMAHLPEPLRGFLGGVPDSKRSEVIFELLTVLGKEVGLSPPR